MATTRDAPESPPAAPPQVPEALADLITPLKHCPGCGYSLNGLPRAHRCPECGAAYDESMFEVRVGISRSGRIWLLISMAIAAAGLPVWLLTRMTVGPGALVVLAGTLCVIAACLLHLRRNRVCYLTPQGIIIGTMPTATRVTWNHLHSVTIRSGSFGVREVSVNLNLVGSAVQTQHSCPIGCTGKQAKLLTEYLRAYGDHMRNHEPPPATEARAT